MKKLLALIGFVFLLSCEPTEVNDICKLCTSTCKYSDPTTGRTVISVSVFEACGDELVANGQTTTSTVFINNQTVTVTCVINCEK